MLEILPAHKYYKNHAVGAVAVHNGRCAVHMATRAAVAQWSLEAFSRILAKLLEQDADAHKLRESIADVEVASRAAQRKSYEQARILERAKARLREIDLAMAA